MRTTYQVRFWIEAICTFALYVAGLVFLSELFYVYAVPAVAWKGFESLQRFDLAFSYLEGSASLVFATEALIPFQVVSGVSTSTRIVFQGQERAMQVHVQLTDLNPVSKSSAWMQAAVSIVFGVLFVSLTGGIAGVLFHIQSQWFETYIPGHGEILGTFATAREWNMFYSLLVAWFAFSRMKELLRRHQKLVNA